MGAEMSTSVGENLDENRSNNGGAGVMTELLRPHRGSTCLQRERDWDRLNEMLDMVVAERDALRASSAGTPLRVSHRGTPVVCGAGHLCCDDPSVSPSHDHFLRQEDCPRCAIRLADWGARVHE